MSVGRRQDVPIRILGILIVFVAYFVTAWLGLQVGAVSGFATLVWPPTGIALAILLLYGYRFWPGIALGAFLVNLVTGASPITAFDIAIGNTLEAVIGVYLLRRFGFDPVMKSLKDMLLFIAFGALVNTLVSATIGVTSLLFAGTVTPATYLPTWIAWWIGDVLGALVIGNLILNLHKGFREKMTHVAEGIVIFSLLIVFNFIVFFDVLGVRSVSSGLGSVELYAIFPLLMWAALRFGTRGAAYAIFFTSTIAIFGTSLNVGPIIGASLSDRLLLLQIFIGTAATTTMILGAAAEELVRKKNQNEAILTSIGDGVLAIDPTGKIMLMNPSAAQLTQFPARKALGMQVENVFQIDDGKGRILLPEERPAYRALSSGRTVTSPAAPMTKLHRQDGTTFPASFSASPIVLDGKIVGAIVVFRDITHEAEIDRSKSEFVSLASHQLRTPIVTQKWYLDMLISEDVGRVNVHQREYLAEAYHNNQRMIELVNALLNVSRIELGTFSVHNESTNLKKLVETIVHDFHLPIKNKRQKIKMDFPKRLGATNVDPNVITIVLENLLSNSIKYSPPRSEIVIRARKTAEELELIVADRGCGIPEHLQKNVFTKFFRAENARTLDQDGNGLGLYLTKSVVEIVGGRISFTSDENNGTTFTVAFPLTSA